MVLAVDELDPETLTALLAGSEVTGGAAVTGVDHRTVGMGQVASCVELTLHLDGGGDAAVVAKVPSDDPTSVATAVAQRLYEREVRFYETLAGTVAIRTPRCAYAAYDEGTGRFLLLLESLSPAAVADQLDGLDPDRAELAIRELAGLHAPHWGAVPNGVTAFLGGVGEALRPMYLEVVPLLVEAFLGRYGERLSAPARDVVGWLRPMLGAYLADGGDPRTVTHGDFRTDNLLFEARGGAVPMATVDWQTVGAGPGALDVAYLLTTSLDREVRVAHERTLLAAYHERLSELGVSGYPMGALRAAYARHAFQGIVMLTCAAVLVEQTERGDAMFLAMIERCAAAVEDLDAKRCLEG